MAPVPRASTMPAEFSSPASQTQESVETWPFPRTQTAGCESYRYPRAPLWQLQMSLGLGKGSVRWHSSKMAAIIDHEARAQQLARAIASDIQLYNKEKIEKALIQDNFFDALNEEITEGRDLFRSRVTPELFHKNFYDRAIIDRVIKTSASVKTSIW